MIYYKTPEEIELIRDCSLLLSKTLAEVAKLLKPGLLPATLDKVAEEFIRDHGGEPAFKGYKNFPYTLCVSVNENVVHGFPTGRELREGDVVSLDSGVKKNGFFSDSAYTFMLGEVGEEAERLVVAAKEALFIGVDKARAGNRVGDISFAIQNYIEREKGYHVVRELVGHGIGKMLHEDPEVPNYGKRGTGALLREGLVIAIEPMVNRGTQNVVQEDDGWTIRTKDRSVSAHFELMVAVRKNKEADFLSTFSFIEAEVAKNPNLKPVITQREILAN
ncbi:MAG TPA: type I methionyl aminopeptidase [Chitinophagales bacterium]|nr:type I methionyl aminopeptidase [Chitinophagales bacterium]